MIEKTRENQAPVYLTGESGTGKESRRDAFIKVLRRDKPFVAVNCGAIPGKPWRASSSAIEGGVHRLPKPIVMVISRPSMVGTLFSDEVGDLPCPCRSNSFADSRKTVRRLGDTTEQMVDFRIISATHQNLHDSRSRPGEFRQDLFYRLNVIGTQDAEPEGNSGRHPDMAAQILLRLARPGVAPHPVLSQAAVKALGRIRLSWQCARVGKTFSNARRGLVRR